METTIEQKTRLFFEKYPEKQYAKHEILIRAEQNPPGIFYLKQGVVRMYAVTTSGEELTMNLFRPHAFFPMSWVINNTTSVHYFEAMTTVRTHIASKNDVMTFVGEHPDVVLDLLSRVYKGLDGLMEHMEYLMVGKAYARLVVVLLISAKRFGIFKNNKISIDLSMTHNDLAMQAGMSRETVTREMKILKQKGIALFEGNRIVVYDIKALEEELLT